jgi:capsular exopolysaccharide synthesis family protein
LVTSAVGSEGKTTTASNLAVVLAQAGKRVILVSADMRRPRLHRFFGLSNERGLSGVLSDSTSVADAIKAPVPNLRVLPSGPVPSNPAELLASRRANELFGALRERADVVILDTPPMLAVADASILAPIADGTLLVINASRAGRSALEQVRDQLGNAGADIIGAVYNNFDPEDLTYPYYYKYYNQYYATEDGAKNGRSKIRRGRKSRQAAGRT